MTKRQVPAPVHWKTLGAVCHCLIGSAREDCSTLLALLKDLEQSGSIQEDLQRAVRQAQDKLSEARADIAKVGTLLEPLIGPDGDGSRAGTNQK